jgi:hypothetical protein
MNMDDTIPNEIVKYYLYTKSMFKDERPIEEPLIFYEAEYMHQRRKNALKEIPI